MTLVTRMKIEESRASAAVILVEEPKRRLSLVSAKAPTAGETKLFAVLGGGPEMTQLTPPMSDSDFERECESSFRLYALQEGTLHAVAEGKAMKV